MAAESVIRLSVINDASPKLRAVDRDAKRLNKTVNKSKGTLNKQNRSLKAVALGWLGVGAGAKAATPGIVGAGVALNSALAPLIGFTTAAAALAAILGVMAKQDAASAALRTLGVDAEELVPKLRDVSDELGNQFSQTELTVAAYDVASAGFTEAGDAAMVLKASALAAKAGMADLATTGDAVTTVLNAWKMSASDAEMVADKMQQTVADGKIKIQEYADNIGKVATVASMVGVPLEEINAAIALTTASGVKAEVAFTGMKTSLLRLTGEAGGKKLKALGIDISAATIESEGLAANLEKLAGLDIKALEQIFGQEAIQVMGPIIANLEKYNELLEKQANSAGVAGRAAKDQAMTIGGAWKELTTVVQNLFSDQSELATSVALLIRMTTGGIKLITSLLQPVFDMMAGISFLVNKTIEGIQHLYEISPDWAKWMMNPNAAKGLSKDKDGSKDGKDGQKDPAVDSLEEQNRLVNLLREGYQKVAETVSGTLRSGIKGLIKGTQTLGDVLSNIANKIADMFLDMAISGIFKGLKIPGYASGGIPPVGKPSIVGEKGPELFVPRQSGRIIPNNQLGGGGGVNVSVNVDASGSSVEGDEQQGRELGQLIAVAIQSELIKQKRPGGLLV